MPTYEYKCEKCKKVFEIFQSITDEPLIKCPDINCGGKVHRLVSGGAGFLFKGNGFYITDYRSESYKKAAEKDKPASEKSSSSESTPKKDGGDSSKATDKTSSSTSSKSKSPDSTATSSSSRK